MAENMVDEIHRTGGEYWRIEWRSQPVDGCEGGWIFKEHGDSEPNAASLLGWYKDHRPDLQWRARHIKVIVEDVDW